VKEYPHRTTAWTEGLSFVDGKLYESTGPGATPGTHGGHLSEIDLTSGNPVTTTAYHGIYGEGAAHVANKFYVLSYKDGKIEEFNNKLANNGEEPLPKVGNGQGWGATSDGNSVVYSDGSDRIRYLNPATKTVTKTISVKDQNGHGVSRLNELEWVNGEIWANVWQTYRIARIDPSTGKVNSWVDLSGIHAPTRDIGANGIAYDASKKMLLVTGKFWDKMYQIKIP
jgi:glutaminyl-peptide cyclotransferase